VYYLGSIVLGGLIYHMNQIIRNLFIRMLVFGHTYPMCTGMVSSRF
jgi:hypothetical protein